MPTARRLATHVATPANRAHSLALVRSFDNENYLANLLQPSSSIRNAHSALRAFNVELDRVRASVSNEDLARLRMSYFRSALAPLLSRQPVSTNLPPVLDCIADTISNFPNTDFTPLNNLINARDAHLAYPSFRTLSDLKPFAAAAHHPLLLLHAAVLLHHLPDFNISDLQSPVHNAATAVGLSIVLRAIPFHAQNRLSYMPRDSLSPSQLLSCNDHSLPVFRSVATSAREHLIAAENALLTLPYNVRPAFWPLIMARLYLDRLAKADHNPFDTRLNLNLRTTWHFALQLRLLRARLLAR